MVGNMEIQLQRLRLILVILLLCEVSCLDHLCQNDITPVTTAVRETNRIKERRILTQADKCGSLGNREVNWLFIKIGISSHFDSHSIMEEVKLVKIHGQYLVFRIIALQFHSYHPFYGFLQNALQGGMGRFLSKELLGQLLGNRGTTAC